MTQKPQLLPAVAVVLAMAIVADRREPLTASRTWLASATLMFAVACKYTFLLPAAATAFVAVAWREGRLRVALASLAVCLLVFPAPVLLRNWLFYGDPLSPFLETSAHIAWACSAEDGGSS